MFLPKAGLTLLLSAGVTFFSLNSALAELDANPTRVAYTQNPQDIRDQDEDIEIASADDAEEDSSWPYDIKIDPSTLPHPKKDAEEDAEADVETDAETETHWWSDWFFTDSVQPAGPMQADAGFDAHLGDPQF